MHATFSGRNFLANESERMTPEVRSAFAAMVRMAKRREAMVATLRSKGHEVRRVPSLVSIGRLWGPANALVTRSQVFWPQFGAGSEPAEETAARVFEGSGSGSQRASSSNHSGTRWGLAFALEPIPASQPLND